MREFLNLSSSKCFHKTELIRRRIDSFSIIFNSFFNAAQTDLLDAFIFFVVVTSIMIEKITEKGAKNENWHFKPSRLWISLRLYFLFFSLPRLISDCRLKIQLLSSSSIFSGYTQKTTERTLKINLVLLYFLRHKKAASRDSDDGFWRYSERCHIGWSWKGEEHSRKRRSRSLLKIWKFQTFIDVFKMIFWHNIYCSILRDGIKFLLDSDFWQENYLDAHHHHNRTMIWLVRLTTQPNFPPSLISGFR